MALQYTAYYRLSIQAFSLRNCHQWFLPVENRAYNYFYIIRCSIGAGMIIRTKRVKQAMEAAERAKAITQATYNL